MPSLHRRGHSRDLSDIPLKWRRRLARYADALAHAWDEWSDTIDAIEDPETDADAEDMGLAFAQFSRLRRLGGEVRPRFRSQDG
ncbi:MAG TPA: hypothetical protein VIM11_17535 [Tepidisphaeraceae bacterium]|jgi:hypothetical protein